MALNLKLSNNGANAQADALGTALNNGYLNIYSGLQPATADDSLSGNTLLASLRFASPAFGAAVGGVITANSIAPCVSANADGTATWYRCFKSDGSTQIMDGSVGTSGCNLNLNSVAIQTGAQVSVSSFQHTVTK